MAARSAWGVHSREGCVPGRRPLVQLWVEVSGRQEGSVPGKGCSQSLPTGQYGH